MVNAAWLPTGGGLLLPTLMPFLGAPTLNHIEQISRPILFSGWRLSVALVSTSQSATTRTTRGRLPPPPTSSRAPHPSSTPIRPELDMQPVRQPTNRDSGRHPRSPSQRAETQRIDQCPDAGRMRLQAACKSRSLTGAITTISLSHWAKSNAWTHSEGEPLSGFVRCLGGESLLMHNLRGLGLMLLYQEPFHSGGLHQVGDSGGTMHCWEYWARVITRLRPRGSFHIRYQVPLGIRRPTLV